MTAVVVAGALANKVGNGGEAWVRLSWVRGLRQIGCEVWFVEQLRPGIGADSPEVAWFSGIIERFALCGRATLLSGEEAIVGPSLADLKVVAEEAALVNISGHLTLPALFDAFRRRVLVDIDPGFTQFWYAADMPGANVAGHDAFFTIGELIGNPGCSVPTNGLNWQPVRQPVVLDDWPVVAAEEPGRFTTIATWRGPFGPVEIGDRRYGVKVHEFRKLIDLPRRSPATFEIALDIHPGDAGDLRELQRHGWRISDPRAAAGDPGTFREYVQGSGAEFSAAQGIYVETACGWFSDRSTRYLASGKPVVLQDTGFGSRLPVGTGLIAFRTLEDATRAAADVIDRYPEHAAGARRIAEDYFAAERVLPSFCERAGIS